MRSALAARDISTVYRLLRRIGVSQRQIAALTGQSQSEVSEILKGRQVMAYDVLARISDGLGVPRGFMGLAYDEATATSVVGPSGDAHADEEDESVKRRKFLAHAAAVTFGAAVLGADGGQWLPSPALTPAPGRIGMTDVKQVVASTRALRALDYQYGGGACRDAVIAQLSWAKRLLGASRTEHVDTKLRLAIADMHNLAGWTSFDSGLLDPSRYHFARALELAKQADDPSLVSNVLYRMGRVYLHNEAANDALKLFQLGQIAAQESGSELAVAVLCANEAWAYALLGVPKQVDKLLGRARDEFARANLAEAPSWVKFFDENDMHAMVGTVYTVLGAKEVKHTAIAIPELVTALAGYREDMARSRAFNLSALATNHLRQGDVDQGVQVGRQALMLAEGLHSVRVVDRMRPLQLEAAKRSTNSDTRDLAERIARFRAA